jgi:hypothetical protein
VIPREFSLDGPFAPQRAVLGQGGEDPGVGLADLRHPGLVVAGEEASRPQRVPNPPGVVYALRDVVSRCEHPVGVAVGAGGVLALLDQDVEGQAGRGVHGEGVVEPPDAVGLGVDAHEAHHERTLLAVRPPGHREARLDVLDVVLVRVPPQVHRVVEEEVEVDARDLPEVDRRLPAIGDVGDVRPRPGLVKALEDPAHPEVDDRLARILFEGEGRRQLDVLPLEPPWTLLEQWLVGREPEDRRRVGGQPLDRHLRVQAGPDDPVLLGEIRVLAALRGGGARGGPGIRSGRDLPCLGDTRKGEEQDHAEQGPDGVDQPPGNGGAGHRGSPFGTLFPGTTAVPGFASIAESRLHVPPTRQTAA